VKNIGRVGRDRAGARAPLAEGYRIQPFRDSMERVHSSAWITFPRAPLRSRTVGFPESGSDRGFPLSAFTVAGELKRWRAYTPPSIALPIGSFLLRGVQVSQLSVWTQPGTATCPEPLCTASALPPRWRCLASPRTALPILLSSYWLMRQTQSLPPTSVVPRSAGLCRLSPVPAGRGPFPTLSLRTFPWMPGPVPRQPERCICPFLPARHRPSPPSDGGSATVKKPA